MKNKSFEQLYFELKNVIEAEEFNADAFFDLARTLEKNLPPEIILTAINANQGYGVVKYLSKRVSSNHENSLDKAFEGKQNPIDLVLSKYIQYKNDPKSKKLLNNIIEVLEVFQEHDCTVSSKTVENFAFEPQILNLLLDYKNIDLSEVNLNLYMPQLDIFKKIIAKGADVNKCVGYNDYPIFQAMHQGNSTAALEILLENKVNLNVKSKYTNKDPLFDAVFSNNIPAAEKLISYGASMFDFELFSKEIPFWSNNIIDFLVKYDKTTKEFIENISATNVYEIFNKAKDENNTPLISYLLKDNQQGKNLFKAIKKEGAQKENIKYFQKNAVQFKYSYINKELYGKPIKNENGKWSVEFGFKENKLLIGSQNHSRDESTTIYNTADIQERSKTYIKNGKIYNSANDKILSCDKFSMNLDVTNLDKEELTTVYILAKDGNLHVQNDLHTGTNHSHFLKGKVGEELYGYGKPIACGGLINVIDGKIKFISNNSGHYMPSLDQLKLAVKYLYNQNVLAEDFKAQDQLTKNTYNLQEILESPVIDDTPDLFGESEWSL